MGEITGGEEVYDVRDSESQVISINANEYRNVHDTHYLKKTRNEILGFKRYCWR